MGLHLSESLGWGVVQRRRPVQSWRGAQNRSSMQDIDQPDNPQQYPPQRQITLPAFLTESVEPSYLLRPCVGLVSPAIDTRGEKKESGSSWHRENSESDPLHVEINFFFAS